MGFADDLARALATSDETFAQRLARALEKVAERRLLALFERDAETKQTLSVEIVDDDTGELRTRLVPVRDGDGYLVAARITHLGGLTP